MDWKKLALCVALAGGTVACGGEPAGDPVTVAYVVSTANIPQPDGNSVVGFDLDDTVSAGGALCSDVMDWESPSNGAGVDNQFHVVAGLLETMVEGGIPGAIEEQIASGSFLLLMEVSDVNSFNNDASVNVHLFLGTVEGGTVAVDGGRIQAGQSFTVETEIATVPASITGGRIVVDGVNLPLNLTVSDNEISLTLRSASVSANITEDGLLNGEIGAYLLVSDIVAIAMDFGLGDEALVRSVVMPDIDEDMDEMCESVSLGLSFETVSAVTAATTVAD